MLHMTVTNKMGSIAIVRKNEIRTDIHSANIRHHQSDQDSDHLKAAAVMIVFLVTAHPIGYMGKIEMIVQLAAWKKAAQIDVVERSLLILSPTQTSRRMRNPCVSTKPQGRRKIAHVAVKEVLPIQQSLGTKVRHIKTRIQMLQREKHPADTAHHPLAPVHQPLISQRLGIIHNTGEICQVRVVW